MAQEEPIVFGEEVVDNSGRLRSSGLVDLIHKFAPRMDAEGRFYTPREPKTVEVKAEIQPDDKKKKVVGGVVICGYDDGTTRSFEVGMRDSRVGKIIAGGDPATIEIIPGDPSRLTTRQARSLGHLLQMSRGEQLSLRQHVKSHMAKHPIVGAIERHAAPWAAIGAALPGGNRLEGAAGAVAGVVVTHLAYPAFHKLEKHLQRKGAELRKKAAAGRR
jgi:hypothetical protein